jgi:hypothetical protein
MAQQEKGQTKKQTKVQYTGHWKVKEKTIAPTSKTRYFKIRYGSQRNSNSGVF